MGICDNVAKDFRLEASYNKNSATLKEFITSNVDVGNELVTDCWNGHAFLDLPNSGYLRIQHILGGIDFGYGVKSTSHVEMLWSQIKSKNKENYHLYPYKVFMMFIREIEYKIKTRGLNDDLSNS